MKDRGMKERELFSLENNFLNIVSPFNLIYKRVCLGFFLFYFIELSVLFPQHIEEYSYACKLNSLV